MRYANFKTFDGADITVKIDHIDFSKSYKNPTYHLIDNRGNGFTVLRNSLGKYVPSVTEKIQQRRYQMLVHSYLYYELGENIISDYQFDYWAKELVDLQEQYPEESKQARYYEEFIDFDGSSGFDLPYNYINIQKRAHRLLESGRNKNTHYNRGKDY
jgi:hypothetical protein